MELSLDGNDWELIPLIPREWESRKVWLEDWNPRTAWPGLAPILQGNVPGDVVSDSLSAGLILHPYKDENSRACEWIAQRDWVYQKKFDVPQAAVAMRTRLLFDGVDYACRVYMNGQLVGTHEGTFLPFEVDVTHVLRAGENLVVVVVEHAPSVDEVVGQVGRTSEARIWKPRFAYNWDWCTRLITLGIWRSVTLIATPSHWIKDVWVRPHTAGSDSYVDIEVQVGPDLLQLPDGIVNARVFAPDGEQIVRGESTKSGHDKLTWRYAVSTPQLWWPNGMGDQPLYRAQVEMLGDGSGEVHDSREIQFGFRTIELVKNDGAPADSLGYTFVVNGRRMFVTGWNWVPLDHMYGSISEERYRHAIDVAKHAHCNLLRVWGGGLREHDCFYELCSEMGIIVWQEFFLSSSGIDNRPPTDREYTTNIDKWARQLLPAMRNFTCIGIWCGGNELMEDDLSPLTDAHAAMRTLKRVVEELSPGTAWLPTSASGPEHYANPDLAGTGRLHDVHGPWLYKGPEGQYELFNKLDPLYHSEFGVEGAANLETLNEFLAPEKQWPPDASNASYVHRGSWWLHREKLEKMFGPLSDMEKFTRASQWVQAEGLRYAVSSNRRRKWYCSGVSPWQLNEAFPNAACTNVYDYSGRVKPAYWALRRAYAPLAIMFKYDRLTYTPGETFTGELWLINGARESLKCSIEARLFLPDGSEIETVGVQASSTTSFSAVGAPLHHAALSESSSCACQITWRFPDASEAFLCCIRVKTASGSLVIAEDYLFSTAEPPFAATLRWPEAQLALTDSTLRNTGKIPGLFLQADASPLALLDNFFCLMPGEERMIIKPDENQQKVTGWNCSL